MIVIMRPFAAQPEIEHVIDRIHSLGFQTHVSQGEERTVIGVVGTPLPTELPELLSVLPGVDQCVRVTKRYKLCSRDFHPADSQVRVGDVVIGGREIVVMAGPCSVENEAQTLETARAVKAAGAHMLRGGAFKPRSSPYDFRGLGEEGLKILAAARDETGLKIVTEVMTPADVDLVCRYADMLQIGARNMQNYLLLEAVGAVDKPVLLKRGMSATIEEWLLSGEYVMARGNRNVVFCERGIRTFETYTRNTFDLSAVPAIKKLSHLPIIADPSHGTGRWEMIPAMSLAAIAAGADGLIVEVHPHPDEALSDGAQSLSTENFATLMPQLRQVAAAVGRSLAASEAAVAG